jgi:OmpA-OmpF porin, OOP family
MRRDCRPRQPLGHAAVQSAELINRSGTPQYNQGLSQRRADTVAAELIRNGVPRDAITVSGVLDNLHTVPKLAIINVF